MKRLSPEELAAALASPVPPRVLDVRLADDFEAAHLPGAVNNTVFEVAFADRLPALLPDPARPVCLYGASHGSDEDWVAGEKLERLGYRSVSLLDGGLAAWRKAGLAVNEGIPLPAAPVAPDGRVEVDTELSTVEWLGRNLLNKHHGAVALKSGHLTFAGGRLAGGEFVVDLTRMACADLAGDTLHDVLIRHLQSDDFFDVERFPDARFAITGVEERARTPGSPNLRLHGDLTIKDRVHAIAFDAAAGWTPGCLPAAQATLAFDRTLWGVLYGSGKHFQRLAGHLVNDLIEIQLRVVGRGEDSALDG